MVSKFHASVAIENDFTDYFLSVLKGMITSGCEMSLVRHLIELFLQEFMN